MGRLKSTKSSRYTHIMPNNTTTNEELVSNYRNKPSLMDNVSTFSVTTNNSSIAANSNTNQLHDDTTYTSGSSTSQLHTTPKRLAYSADETTTTEDEDYEELSRVDDSAKQSKFIDDVGEAMMDAGKDLWNFIDNFMGTTKKPTNDRYEEEEYSDEETTVYDDDGSSIVSNVRRSRNVIPTINDSKCQTIYEEDLNATASTAAVEQRDDQFFPSGHSATPTTFTDVFKEEKNKKLNVDCDQSSFKDGKDSDGSKGIMPRIVNPTPPPTNDTKKENTPKSTKTKKSLSSFFKNKKKPSNNISSLQSATSHTSQHSSTSNNAHGSSLSISSISLKNVKNQPQIVIKKQSGSSPFSNKSKLVVATLQTGVLNKDTRSSSNLSVTSTLSSRSMNSNVSRNSRFKKPLGEESTISNNEVSQNPIPKVNSNTSTTNNSLSTPIIRVRQRSLNSTCKTISSCSFSSDMNSISSFNKQQQRKSKKDAAIHFTTPIKNSKEDTTYESSFLNQMQKDTTTQQNSIDCVGSSGGGAADNYFETNFKKKRDDGDYILLD